ncbi:NRR repressor homolog 1-like [Ipomoea triloba]|uniref:NRR repressor homolog 1-like n=1 Tax=Ipomoea triloba TaxID=35885 RepID=UPI00125D7109|nr:NRR repressor homolog 1-like [Ipomoea triloba]XP_031101170.1 NRR repressor homolog 1-like [Ipomoea triloba]XP_031101171.1 NRR repressor homolog 1-like [Ipomoea triloba]
MGVEKRKRLNDVEVPGKKARAAPAPENDGKTNNPVAAEEEEVEEFFAILRRIQVAVKYFGKVNGESGGGGRKATAEMAVRPWNPSFRREDFEEIAEAPETVVNTGLDLNTEPDCQPTDDKKPV